MAQVARKPPPQKRPPKTALRALEKVRAANPAVAACVPELLRLLDIRIDSWRCWRQRYLLVYREHERLQTLYGRRKKLMKQRPFAKAVEAAEKAKEEPKLVPLRGMDPKRQQFLRNFAKDYDRVAAAHDAGLDWEALEEEMAEDGPLKEHFDRIERRQGIQLRDALRKKVILEGNAAALNALLRNGMLAPPGSQPEDGGAGAADADYAAFARGRMAKLRELHELDNGEIN